MMTHHHLGFKSSCGLKRYAYNDEYRGTSHCDRQLGDNTEDDGEDSNDTQEHSSHQSDLSEYPLEVIAGRLTGSYTGNAAVVLSQIVSDLNRVVRHTYIEVVESDDENEVETAVERMSILKPFEESFIERTCLGLFEQLECLGDSHKAHRKDDGENAAHSDLDRDEGVLSAVLLSAYHTLGILYRYPSLGIVHKYDECDHKDEYYDDYGNEYQVLGLACAHQLEERHERFWTSCNDTCEQQHGYAVADTLFIYSVAKPYRQH